jgi:hypothetical protein
MALWSMGRERERHVADVVYKRGGVQDKQSECRQKPTRAGGAWCVWKRRRMSDDGDDFSPAELPSGRHSLCTRWKDDQDAVASPVSAPQHRWPSNPRGLDMHRASLATNLLAEAILSGLPRTKPRPRPTPRRKPRDRLHREHDTSMGEDSPQLSSGRKRSMIGKKRDLVSGPRPPCRGLRVSGKKHPGRRRAAALSPPKESSTREKNTPEERQNQPCRPRRVATEVVRICIS